MVKFVVIAACLLAAPALADEPRIVEGVNPHVEFSADTLPADSQPTPWPAVGAMLNALAPKPDEVLLDPGCGYDARLLIQACRYFGTERAIGVEIDPVLAESARRHVELAGLADRIEIITGDSTKLDLKADVGVAYMWAEVLTELKPSIETMDRFVCFGFAVPGLSMTETTIAGGGKVYLWTKPAPVAAVTQVPITKTVSRIDRLPRGSYCQICGRHCSNPMAHVRQQQIVGYETKPTESVKPTIASAPRQTSVSTSNCPNGNCKKANVRVGVFGRRR